VPNFETFRRSLVPLRSEPSVTIQKRGAVSLNLSAYTALGSPDSVELLFDAALQIVGLRPVDPKADSAYRVRPGSGVGGPFLVSAATFLRFHDIAVEASTRWPAALDGDVLCVDLTAPGVPVTSNRANTGRSAR
jgi:hypothetical protein